MTFARAKASDKMMNGATCFAFVTARFDDDICAPPFDMVRNLKPSDLLEFGVRHAPAAHHPFGLHPHRSGNHNDQIGLLRRATALSLFKVKRDIENDHRPGAVAFEESLARVMDRRMDDPFERPQFVGLAQNHRPELLPVDPAGTG